MKKTGTELDATESGSEPVQRARRQADHVPRLERSSYFTLEQHCLLPEVQKAMGDAETSAFMRLYMVPGMEHCVGGPGPAAFGQLGLSTTGGPKYGVFDALVDWVEKGTPAENVIATKYSAETRSLMTGPCAPTRSGKIQGQRRHQRCGQLRLQQTMIGTRVILLIGLLPGIAVAQTATPIKHLVVIFDENVSFDHYFATYPHAFNRPHENAFHAIEGTPEVNGLAPALLERNPIS